MASASSLGGQSWRAALIVTVLARVFVLAQSSHGLIPCGVNHQAGATLRRTQVIRVEEFTVNLTLALHYVDDDTSEVLSLGEVENAIYQRFCGSVNLQSGGRVATGSAAADGLVMFTQTSWPYPETGCSILATNRVYGEGDGGYGPSFASLQVHLQQTVFVSESPDATNVGPVTAQRVQIHVANGFRRGAGGRRGFMNKLQKETPEPVPAYDAIEDVEVLDDGLGPAEERPFPIAVPSTSPVGSASNPTTEAPTAATAIPSELPTDAPTDVPTEAPTHAPTTPPTEAPTKAPTAPAFTPRQPPGDPPSADFPKEPAPTPGAETSTAPSAAPMDRGGEGGNSSGASGGPGQPNASQGEGTASPARNDDEYDRERILVIASCAGLGAAMLVALLFSVYFLHRRRMDQKRTLRHRRLLGVGPPPSSRRTPECVKREEDPPLPFVDVDGAVSLADSTLGDRTAGRKTQYSLSSRPSDSDETDPNDMNTTPASFLAGDSVQLSSLESLGADFVSVGFSLEAAIKEEEEEDLRESSGSCVGASPRGSTCGESDGEGGLDGANERMRGGSILAEIVGDMEPPSLHVAGNDDFPLENYDHDHDLLKRNITGLGLSVDLEEELMFPDKTNVAARSVSPSATPRASGKGRGRAWLSPVPFPHVDDLGQRWNCSSPTASPEETPESIEVVPSPLPPNPRAPSPHDDATELQFWTDFESESTEVMIMRARSSENPSPDETPSQEGTRMLPLLPDAVLEIKTPLAKHFSDAESSSSSASSKSIPRFTASPPLSTNATAPVPRGTNETPPFQGRALPSTSDIVSVTHSPSSASAPSVKRTADSSHKSIILPLGSGSVSVQSPSSASFVSSKSAPGTSPIAGILPSIPTNISGSYSPGPASVTSAKTVPELHGNSSPGIDSNGGWSWPIKQEIRKMFNCASTAESPEKVSMASSSASSVASIATDQWRTKLRPNSDKCLDSLSVVSCPPLKNSKLPTREEITHLSVEVVSCSEQESTSLVTPPPEESHAKVIDGTENCAVVSPLTSFDAQSPKPSPPHHVGEFAVGSEAAVSSLGPSSTVSPEIDLRAIAGAAVVAAAAIPNDPDKESNNIRAFGIYSSSPSKSQVTRKPVDSQSMTRVASQAPSATNSTASSGKKDVISAEGSSVEGRDSPWLFDAVEETLGPMSADADLESLGGRSNRSRQSSVSHRSNQSHRSISKSSANDDRSNHLPKSRITSDKSIGSQSSRGSKRSSSELVKSQSGRRAPKPYISNLSDIEDQKKLSSDLQRLETKLSKLGSFSPPPPGTSSSSSVTSKSLASSRGKMYGRTKIQVTAPAGKLGIILANRSDGHGTVVSDVRSSSVLSGKILPGDRIVAVDGEDVSRLIVSDITAIMARKAESERQLSVVTPNRVRGSPSSDVGPISEVSISAH